MAFSLTVSLTSLLYRGGYGLSVCGKEGCSVTKRKGKIFLEHFHFLSTSLMTPEKKVIIKYDLNAANSVLTITSLPKI